jgi:dienelactone hydrolase
LALAALVGCRAKPPTVEKPVEQRFRDFLFFGRPLGHLAPQLLSDQTKDGLRIERIAFEPEAGERAVAVVMSAPPDPRIPQRPVIVLQHWLGGTKDALPLVRAQQALAQSGYLAVAIDGRYRGERQRNGVTLEAAMIRAYKTGKGHPWLVDTAFDLIRLADYLVTRPDVDVERIGVVGLSEGGFEAWMAAVADPRYKVIVPVVGLTRFSRIADPSNELYNFHRVFQAVAEARGENTVTPETIRAFWERMLPGFDQEFDPIRLAPTLAPRPLLILAHENDQIVPVQGAKEVYEAALERYRKAGSPDKIQFRVEPGLSHEEQSLGEWMEALDWCNKWLKPGDGDEGLGEGGHSEVEPERENRNKPLALRL